MPNVLLINGVHIAPMTDSDDQNHETMVLNCIDDSAVAHANTLERLMAF
jgi:hypothetical protein